MSPSLLDFLNTGTIDRLHLGMTAEEVQSLLGPPDDLGGTSRRYPRPSIYVYGSVELFFTRTRPARCHGIWWYAHRGPFRLAVGHTDEKLFSPDMRRSEIEARLTKADLAFEHLPTPQGISPTLMLRSGVTIIFDEDGSLYAVMAREL